MKDHPLEHPILLTLGLNESEARVYESILAFGRAKPRDLVQSTGLGRPNVYHVLSVLEQKKLVVRIEGEQVQYQALDPENLKSLLEERRAKLAQTEAEAEIALPKLMQAFLQKSSQPVARVYEGYDGYKKAIDVLHQSTTDILTYVDVAAITGTLAELDDYYERGRVKKGIRNRVLVSYEPSVIEAFAKPAPDSEVRFLHNFPHAFGSSMHITSDALVYFTLRNGHDIALLIQDPMIIDLHRQMFEFLWVKGKARES
ncbi:MAG: HTH-type transcriptional regulator, sugar sensing transcriptional regulator [Patescibacteria group bacterium]|nr:HTH-type transcriptional regulator, sugar sensing transcriptional regulator [Patescibacteria group bacterium]